MAYEPEDWIDDLFQRVKLLEKVALTNAGVTKVDVSNVYPYAQNTFPYLINRLLPTRDEDLSEDVAYEEQGVGVRIVVGNATDQLGEDRARLAYHLLVVLRRYFRKHTDLYVHGTQDEDSPVFEEPRWLAADGLKVGPHTGLGIFAAGGVGNQQIGIELSLLVPVINQVF